ncbi:MAG: hypothetical protein Q4P13_11400 [Psychrobacter sp.]|nr:hypothetical protein [Psychrobacter sp.]
MTYKLSRNKSLVPSIRMAAAVSISLLISNAAMASEDGIRASVLPILQQAYDNLKAEYMPVVLAAESMADPSAQKVLQRARTMTLNERAIIRGGCWDYLNRVFKQAGVERQTVFEGKYRGGPYADADSLRSGDWLYYINHGYKDIEHSGLFIGWVDKPARQALILSYAGEQRREPARYKVYDLSHVYQVMRPMP